MEWCENVKCLSLSGCHLAIYQSWASYQTSSERGEFELSADLWSFHLINSVFNPSTGHTLCSSKPNLQAFINACFTFLSIFTFNPATLCGSPFTESNHHSFFCAPLTFLSTIHSTYPQYMFHPLVSQIFSFQSCFFHFHVNYHFNRSTLPFSPSSKPNHHPFLKSPFIFLSTLHAIYIPS